MVPIYGEVFPIFLPMMLMVMCLINLFNLQGKVMNAIGLGSYAEKVKKEGVIEEGKRIL
jgi:hypothetical protein